MLRLTALPLLWTVTVNGYAILPRDKLSAQLEVVLRATGIDEGAKYVKPKQVIHPKATITGSFRCESHSLT
jgi:hypothetical protein